MSSFRLRTLGGLSIGGEGAEGLATQRKSLVLLAILAASGSRGISRDRLLSLLWPDSDTERARGALKQSLHAMRRQLRVPDVVAGVGELRLDPQVISSDWEDFRAALDRGDDTVAAGLYGGPFLDGVFAEGSPELDRWIEEERARLARRFGEALERLGEACAASGDLLGAVRQWQRRHESDPLNARISMRLMDAMARAGDRAGAIQHARVHEALMRSELELPADPAVLTLAGALRSAPPSSPSAHAAAPAPTALPPSFPAEAHTAAAAPRRSYRRLVATGIAAVAVLALSVAWWRAADAGPAVDLVPNRVAVAIFVNRTGERDLDALGTMASDWVTRGLARTSLAEVFDVGGLYVEGRRSDGAPTDPRALARANGAGIVVAGNYYRDGTGLMFSVQLLDVASGRLLRSLEPIPANPDAPLEGVEEVRQRVASALGTVLDPRVAMMTTPAMVPPRYDAYTEYAAGQEIYWRGDWEGALPHFRRAALLDTNFTAAIVHIGVVGVGTGRCDLADSVARVLTSRAHVDPIDLIGARLSTARCASDHATHNQLHRERAALLPGSRFVQMVLSTGFRQLNQPAEALAILAQVRPDRDLGWLPVRGRTFYWREVAANEHALRDYRAERRTAERMRQHDVAPLATGFVRARSLAALGQPDSALAILDTIAHAPPDPSLIAGITGRLNPVDVATPGWVMWQVALELSAHGHEAQGRAAAERSVTWFAAHDPGSATRLATTLMHARALEFLGRLGESRTLLDRLLALDSTSVDVRGTLGMVAVRQGDDATARVSEQWLRADRGFPPGLPRWYRAGIASVRGDSVRAAALLDSLPHQVHPTDILQFHLDPALSALRRAGKLERWLVPRGG